MLAPTRAACISPPRLDGSTKLALDLPVGWLEDPTAATAALVSEAARRRSRGAEARDRYAGGRSITLPCWGGGWVTADIRVQGERKQRVVLHIIDIAHITVDLERSPREGFAGRVTVELKAPLLWSVDRASQGGVVSRWLRTVQSWVLGHARAQDWRCIAVELCADYVGTPWVRDDAKRLVVPRSQLTAGEMVTTTIGPSTHERASLTFGARGGTMSVCLYDKSAQIRAAKGGDDAMYAWAWRQGGWQPDEQVSRVEFRLASSALTWLDPGTGEVLSMVTFGELFDPRVMDAVWSLLTRRVRLGVPGRTRRKRWPVDPRWEVVRSASSVTMPMMQQCRHAQAGTHALALRRASLDAWRAAQRWGSLRGVQCTSDVAVERLFRAAYMSMDAEVRGTVLQHYAAQTHRRRRAWLDVEMDASFEKLQREHADASWWEGIEHIDPNPPPLDTSDAEGPRPLPLG